MTNLSADPCYHHWLLTTYLEYVKYCEENQKSLTWLVPSLQV